MNKLLTDKSAVFWCLAMAVFLLLLLFSSSHRFMQPVLTLRYYIFIGGCLCMGITGLMAHSGRPAFPCFWQAISVTAFIVYILIWNLLLPAGFLRPLLVISFFIAYLAFGMMTDRNRFYFGFVITAVCTLLAAWGVLQYFGLFTQESGMFAVQGNFDNQAGFAACLAGGYPFGLMLLNGSRQSKIVGFASLIIIGAAVVLSGTRAGILAIGVVTAYYVVSRYSVKVKNKKLWIAAGSLLVILVSVGLFMFKKDSALGRMLIWENSISLFLDGSVWGNGPGSFQAKYMLYQAEFFSRHPQSHFSVLADNVSHPFNEYLLWGIEYGCVGLLLLVVAVVVLLIKTKKISVFHLCLLSLAVFACFSYPIRYPFTLLLMAYCLAAANRERICPSKKIPAGLKWTMMGIIGVCGVFLIRDISFETQWKRTFSSQYSINPEMNGENYVRLYERWNGNPLFLYNYAIVLHQENQYEKSNQLLRHCTKYWNDYDIQMVLALNYTELGSYEKAEAHYIRAAQMCPNRFSPLFHLVGLYDLANQSEKADSLSIIIMNKEAKIPSLPIEQMRDSLKKRTSQTGS